jgi:hypothetical protein
LHNFIKIYSYKIRDFKEDFIRIYINIIKDFEEDFRYCKRRIRVLELWDLVAPTRLTFDYGDSSQVLVNGNFGPLSKELYDLGNILELYIRHDGMVT